MSEEKFSKGIWRLDTEMQEDLWFLDVVNNNGERHGAISEFVVSMDSDISQEYKDELKSNAYLQSQSKNMYNLLKELKEVSTGAYPEIIEKQLARSRGELQ